MSGLRLLFVHGSLACEPEQQLSPFLRSQYHTTDSGKIKHVGQSINQSINENRFGQRHMSLANQSRFAVEQVLHIRKTDQFLIYVYANLT